MYVTIPVDILKDLLKVKELIHYVNFVGDNATPNVLTHMTDHMHSQEIHQK